MIRRGHKKTLWIGRLLVGFDWAEDGKWDWTSDRGDKHSDFASVARCVRGDNPPLYRLTLGPLALSFLVAPRPA